MGRSHRTNSECRGLAHRPRRGFKTQRFICFTTSFADLVEVGKIGIFAKEIRIRVFVGQVRDMSYDACHLFNGMCQG